MKSILTTAVRKTCTANTLTGRELNPAMYRILFEDQTVESPVAQQEERQRNGKLFQELFIHVVLCSRRF